MFKGNMGMSVGYIIFRIKRMIFRALKTIHNVLFAIGIDIRIRKKEIDSDAVIQNSLDEINKFYSSEEIQFAITSGEHQKFFLRIIEVLEREGIDLKDKNIADFGCGIGNLLLHMDKHFKPHSCHGFDFSETLLELAIKRFPNGHFTRHDIYITLNQKFDFVSCTEVLEHLLYPDKALKSILETVNVPGGIAFLSVPDGRKDTYINHINFWSPESWEVFVRNHIERFSKIETGYLDKNNLFAIIQF